MRKSGISGFFIVGACAALLLCGLKADAFARPPRQEHHHPYRGIVVPFLSDVVAKLVIYGGREYYFDDGYFYRREPGGFVIVDPPAGAVIKYLPRGYKIVVIGGRSYFYYNDTYYLRSRQGYLVVDNPVYQIVEPPVEVFKAEVAAPSADTAVVTGIYSVNIPNADGTYTEVTLKKTDGGFIGPQGELYRKFPSVQQLKEMYGK